MIHHAFVLILTALCFMHQNIVRASATPAPQATQPKQVSAAAQAVNNRLKDSLFSTIYSWTERKKIITKALKQDSIDLAELRYKAGIHDESFPLLEAVENDDVTFVQELLTIHHADATQMVDSYRSHKPILAHAYTTKMANILLKHGAYTSVITHSTLLLDVVQSYKALDEPELITLYTQHGQDPQSKDEKGHTTLLWLAIKACDADYQKYAWPVIASGVSLEHVPHNGEWKGYTAPQIIRQKIKEAIPKKTDASYYDIIDAKKKQGTIQAMRTALLAALERKQRVISEEPIKNDIVRDLRAFYEDLEKQDVTELADSRNAYNKAAKENHTALLSTSRMIDF